MPNIRKKIRNIICFLSDRRFFWSIMLAYVFIKLLPVVAFDKRFTYLVVFISFITVILRIIKIIIYDKKIVINKYRITTILFIITCLFSIFYNIGLNFSNINIKNDEYRIFIVLVINLFVLFSFCSENDYKNDIIYLRNILFIVSIFSFINIIFSIIDTIINNKERIWGLTISVWSFTHFVVDSFAINLYLLIGEKRLVYKAFFAINGILHLITLIFVQQRAGYLSLIIGLLISLILLIVTGRISKLIIILKKNKILLFIILFMIIFLIIVLSHYINLNKIYGKLLNFNTNGRFQIKEISLKCLLDNKAILFGLIGNLHNVVSNFEYSALKVYISNAAFHDILFCILMCFGIIALSVFLFFIVQIIKKILALIKYAEKNDNIFNLLLLSSFAIFGSLVGGFFDDNMIINLPYLPNLLFFILTSIICSIDEKRLDIVK